MAFFSLFFDLLVTIGYTDNNGMAFEETSQ